MSERRVTRWSLCLVLGISLTCFGCGGGAPIDTSTVPLPQDVPKLLENLNGESAGGRGMAAKYLGNLGENGKLGEDRDKVLAKLKELAQKDPNPSVKQKAADAVAKIEAGG